MITNIKIGQEVYCLYGIPDGLRLIKGRVTEVYHSIISIESLNVGENNFRLIKLIDDLFSNQTELREYVIQYYNDRISKLESSKETLLHKITFLNII